MNSIRGEIFIFFQSFIAIDVVYSYVNPAKNKGCVTLTPLHKIISIVYIFGEVNVVIILSCSIIYSYRYCL